MIFLFTLSAVEVYVLLVVVAAAVVALCVKPSARGEAVVHLLAGKLCQLEDMTSEMPSVDFECADNGEVFLSRRGLKDLTESDAVSLVVTVIGFDVKIEERIVAGKPGDEPVDTALFTLDFLARERYHIRYISEPTATAASLTLHNRPGMHMGRQLLVNS